MSKLVFCLAMLALSVAVPAQQITLRHELQGEARDALTRLAERFNASQKGRTAVQLQGIDGADGHASPPVAALLDIDDSRRFFGTLPRFKPLHQAVAETGQPLGRMRLLPLIADAASDPKGRLEALPLALSLPALFWNKADFRRAGLDPERAPATWQEVQDAAGALADHGSRCPLTSSRFAWVHLENVAAQHGEAMVTRPGAVTLNNLIGVKHLALLSSWNRSRYFHYFGAGREADVHFLSGECAMITGEARFDADARRAGMDFGMAALPYYADVYGADRANVVPDGASLWLLAGHGKEEYRVALRFIAFLLQPQNQRDWVRATGFLPMTREALAVLRASGSPADLMQAAELRLSSPRVVARPRGMEMLQPLHEALSEEMPFVWGNGKPAKQALDNAMQRVNAGLPASGGRRL